MEIVWWNFQMSKSQSAVTSTFTILNGWNIIETATWGTWYSFPVVDLTPFVTVFLWASFEILSKICHDVLFSELLEACYCRDILWERLRVLWRPCSISRKSYENGLFCNAMQYNYSLALLETCHCNRVYLPISWQRRWNLTCCSRFFQGICQGLETRPPQQVFSYGITVAVHQPLFFSLWAIRRPCG